MIPISDMLPFITPFARGAGEPAAELELRNATIAFCKGTHVWQQTLDPKLDITADSREVEIPLPDQAELLEIREVWYRNDKLDAISTDLLKQLNLTPASMGKPQGYEFSEWVLKLWPIPIIDEESVLDVRVSLYPTDDADEIHETLFRRYRQEISHGALARLMRYDEPWARTAAQAARAQGQDYAGMFQASIDQIRGKVAKSNVRARRRVTPAFF